MHSAQARNGWLLMLSRTPRQRKCGCGCGTKFVPVNSLNNAASIECALRIARAKREKENRKELNARRMELKPIRWFLSKAQDAVNAYIRERDKEEPCISCGRWDVMSWHAGHYKSVGAHPELRFNHDNIHKQCDQCNLHKSANIAEYRPRLIAKIGIERVTWLEGHHESAHYTLEDCRRIEAEHKSMLKEIRGRQ